MEKKGELPDKIKKQLARYEELLQYDNATVSTIDAYRNSLPNRHLIDNSSYDTNTINRWASEIEEFAIAVTERRINGR